MELEVNVDITPVFLLQFCLSRAGDFSHIMQHIENPGGRNEGDEGEDFFPESFITEQQETDEGRYVPLGTGGDATDPVEENPSIYSGVNDEEQSDEDEVPLQKRQRLIGETAVNSEVAEESQPPEPVAENNSLEDLFVEDQRELDLGDIPDLQAASDSEEEEPARSSNDTENSGPIQNSTLDDASPELRRGSRTRRPPREYWVMRAREHHDAKAWLKQHLTKEILETLSDNEVADIHAMLGKTHASYLPNSC